ncbi:MAG: hypothetical protein LN414_06710, partial [Candidatus Thermoplasmatota archaeon]|nr:hypothetical protein [Candidatus Thermoplasmatota archaeon]
MLLMTLGAILAIVMVLSPSEGAEGAPTDPEPPAQYDDWDHAYEMDYYELGTLIVFRKEGGGDRDYVRIPFLSLGDRVTIDVEIDNTTNSSEWRVSDPGRFPIWTCTYDQGQANPLPMKFEFLVTLPGPYWFHTGQGLGVRTLLVKITCIPSSDRGDGNER